MVVVVVLVVVCFLSVTCNIDIAILSGCLSVHLSIRQSVRGVPGLDENGLTYCHSFFTVW